MAKKFFKSKILLFGEYSIIHDSMGLTIPFDFFKGKLTFKSRNFSAEQAAESNRHLKEYATFLRSKVDNGELNFKFDIEALEKDIEKGILFDSTIPQGFGVGSSGALVAALYDRYAFDKIINEEAPSGEKIIELKSHFAQMESYFHGTSSGIDPLICYLQEPLLINSKTSINPVGMPGSTETDGNRGIFLINTGNPGKTQPMVNIFLDKCREDGFVNLVRKEMIPFNNNCIKAFLKGEVKELLSNVKELSKFLLEYLNPMIPEKYQRIWKQGLETETYYLKLCGSGGGGYLLGFTEDLEKTRQELKDVKIEVIHRF
ncbi:MAG: mevalonate kinase [Flavobacteriales bacterium]|nr:mevalonate kinase [Flavobacteriales bacterium]